MFIFQQLHRHHHNYLILIAIVGSFFAFASPSPAETVNQRAEREAQTPSENFQLSEGPPGAPTLEANRHAEAEAQSFFLPCAPAQGSKSNSCRNDQKSFAESWILSEAGSTYFMGDLIGYLDPMVMPGDAQKPETIIRHDKLTACAWRYIRWKYSPLAIYEATYRDDWQLFCFGQGAPDMEAQKAAVVARLNRMHDFPPVMTHALTAKRARLEGDETMAVAVIAEAQRLFKYIRDRRQTDHR